MRQLLSGMSALLFFTLLFTSCSDDEVPATTFLDTATVWEGSNITFSKEAGADPALEANQDRITDNVWITRGDEGQIYNAKTEDSASKTDSPAGTSWAVGTLDQANDLTFTSFREAVVNPKTAVDRDLLMYLEDDNILISVKITSWDQNKQGGFTYERSTP